MRLKLVIIATCIGLFAGCSAQDDSIVKNDTTTKEKLSSSAEMDIEFDAYELSLIAGQFEVIKDPLEIAGEYSIVVTGLTERLVLRKDYTFQLKIVGCMGTLDESSGRWKFRGKFVQFTKTNTNAAIVDSPLTPMVAIKSGDRMYLFEKSDYRDLPRFRGRWLKRSTSISAPHVAVTK